jgi:hypothetical protein
MNLMVDAIEKIIFHFPFVILDLSLKKIGRAVSSMTNLKLQMENEK